MTYLDGDEICTCPHCQMVRRVLNYDLNQVRQRYAQLMAIARMRWDESQTPLTMEEAAEFPMLAEHFVDLTIGEPHGTA